MPSLNPPNPNARQLVEAMSSSAALPAFVRRINPHTLKSLVDEVGLEDAGTLIAHVSNKQLVHLLDETLWTGARPGDPDKLSVAELLRWFDLWNGIGTGFAADKLYELGDDFCALAFSRLLVVVDFDMAPRVLDEHSHAIGRYIVRVRVDDEWDVVQTAVTALWHDYPDYCEAIFARLAFRHSVLKLSGEDDTAQVLDSDASHAHEQGREESGYVTSVMAGSFLRKLLDADVDELSAEAGYDLQTREYFRRRTVLKQQAVQEAAVRADLDVAFPEGAQAQDEPEAELSPPTGSEASRELRNLEAELMAYERGQMRPAALLTGPETAEIQEADWIRVALGRLQRNPSAFDARMDELTYLSNLVMEGTESGGERLESSEAANLVIATCNLGACHDLWLETEPDPVEAVQKMLATAPGLVRLFRIGWHLLSNLPRDAAARLKALFADPLVRATLSEKPWVLSEVDGLLGNPDFETVVSSRNFDDAQETLKILAIGLEPEAVVVLCVLTDGVPRFARLLEQKPPEGAVMTYASRYIATMKDLLALHRFLDNLEAQVRL
jgi:hypothetical protein